MIVRPFEPGDQAAVLVLSHRSTIGVAAWGDREHVAGAVRGWAEARWLQG